MKQKEWGEIMKKQNILFTFVLGLLLSSCNPYSPSSSGLTNSKTTISNNSPMSISQVSTSSVHVHTFDETYIYDGYYHWKVATCEHDEKGNYGLHNYVEGKCADCGYVEASNEYLSFEAIDEKTYGVKGCNKEAVEITIPYFYENKEIVVILDKAFQFYKSLTTIEIPSSVTNIYEYAFCFCTSLTSIVIPSSVTSIGKDAFANSSLDNVYYKGTIEDWCNIQFSDLYSSPMSSALNFYILDQNNLYQEITKIEIPNTITAIGDYQFRSFSKITEIIIPNSVTSIGRSTFEYCTSLTRIVIPSSVTSIRSGAFYGCTNLTNVEIQNGVTSIGGWAFYYCRSLTSIVIPSSVTSIENHTFFGCNSLTSIVIPNSLTSIGKYAFYECRSLTSIIIPSSVRRIDAYAFSGCTNLTNAEIQNGVTSIGSYAFETCTSLTSIVIPSSVTSIEEYAFKACTSLTSIIIPSSVRQIGAYAFSDCDSLTIYCEVKWQTSGWNSNWNPDNRPVVWDYKG